MNLYIYKYNNYYNRTHKKAGDSIADYEDYLYYGPVTGVYGFTPGDGVNTTQVIGTVAQPYYDGSGNYLIAHDPKTNTINSRWFIIDHNRTREGQWQLTLHRDLFTDFYNDIIEAPTYIEKAILNDEDPLIFNSEQLNVNQIKTSQEAIKDRSGSAWLVGYLSAKQTEDIEFEVSKTIDYNIAVDSLSNWELINFSNFAAPGQKKQGYVNLGMPTLSMRVAYAKQGFAQSDLYTFNLFTNYAYIEEGDYINTTNFELHYKNESTVDKEYVKNTIKNNCQNYKTQIENMIKNSFDTFDYSNLFNEYNGKILYDMAADKYYTVYIRSGASNKLEFTPSVSSQQDLNLITYSLGAIQSVDYTTPRVNYYLEGSLVGRPQNLTTSATSAYKLSANSHLLEIILEEVESVNTTTSIKTSAKQLKDAPYKMFCMPYKMDSNFNFLYRNVTYTMNRDTSMSVMNKLISQLSGANVLYDAQILPYCPCSYLIDELGQFNLSTLINGEPLQEDIDFTLIRDTTNNNIEGFLVYCNYASFSVAIDKTIVVDNVKISNECDKYRLCSPNFNGAFDFNLAKNRGLQGFKVSCTYKPYQPYIKIAPIFGGLYGENFQDPRGLVCGGDFGLPLANDQWASYEINNKNYLNSFNRQIENMEIQQKYQRIGEVASSIAGIGTGAAGGALAGSVIMPGIGTAIGAVGGALSSAAGGIADILVNEKLRAEALDYTKDQFNYSLQNIQALPYTLSRVSAINIDNTIYPILEYYTCTAREKEALANKIAYNSMTVMAIGKIKDYINNNWSYGNITSKGYIKGKLIRIENFNDDFHMINAISEEINKGVYIQ